jgi:hypothetical protein
MNQETGNGKKPSFFTKHLHITGIETSSLVSESDIAGDLKAMDGIDLPNLDFRSVARNSEKKKLPLVRLLDASRSFINNLFSEHTELLGVAAMLLLFILPLSTMKSASEVTEVIRAKGGDKITIYKERQGTVSQIARFEQSLALENGDRIRIEVLAGAERHAFYFISSASKMQVLSSVQEIQAEGISLKAGDRAIFPGSVELIGVNEGETLNVLLCDSPLSGAQLSEMISEYPQNGVVTPKSCLLKTIRLR